MLEPNWMTTWTSGIPGWGTFWTFPDRRGRGGRIRELPKSGWPDGSRKCPSTWEVGNSIEDHSLLMMDLNIQLIFYNCVFVTFKKQFNFVCHMLHFDQLLLSLEPMEVRCNFSENAFFVFRFAILGCFIFWTTLCYFSFVFIFNCSKKISSV